MQPRYLFLFAALIHLPATLPSLHAQPYQATGIKIGETDATSAVVWTRLTANELGDPTSVASAAPGAPGEVRVRYWPEGQKEKAQLTSWVAADSNRDFTRQIRLTELQPGTRHFLEVESRSSSSERIRSRKTGEFKTAPAPDSIEPVTAAMVTCQGIGSQDSPLGGHLTYRELAEVKPDFFVHTGDVLYYDKHYDGLHPLSQNVVAARQRWNRMFSYYWNQNFHRFASSYFLKDDHDTLKNDCWPGQTYGDLTFAEGVAIFDEQTPSGDRPYSTVRWGRDLQIWLLEQREFRSPNTMPDGPSKSILGAEQKQWLKRTLRESDATFKLVIGPGPIVGPDKPGKNDNLANEGFQTEGDEIRRFLASIPNTFAINGDRHWQYASVDPVTGLREYGCGPINPEHDYGGDPGEDPRYHTYFAPSGGYFSARVERVQNVPQITFRWHDSGTIDPATDQFRINHEETIVAGRSFAAAQPPESRPSGAFQFPTSTNDAEFQFTSFPDLFNWNIRYPQPGWEDAMDWFLSGMKLEGPAFSLCAGDIMDARWWSSPEEVRRETDLYWGGFRSRFEDKNIQLYIAPGDHEYGDDQGLTKMNLAPVFAEQFSNIFDMPRNGPAHKKGLAYSFEMGPLAVISVDTFEDAGNRMSMTVSGEQLRWLRSELEKYRDKPFLIVQGHVPVVGPVASKNSSANMLEGGTNSDFWKTMVEHGVDAYLCGEHHRITAKKHDGIWQIVHGALWGTQTDLNYLRGSVWNDRLEMELFGIDVEYGGERLTGQHPHRGNGGPWSEVNITESTRKNGPSSLGKLVIEARPRGNQTTVATGEFARHSSSN